MIDKKNYKICEKVFSLKELEDVHQFVFKKLNVDNLYKLRDRCDGNKFLINTTRKVFFLKSLFNYLDIENYQKIKIGFLNTINTENFTSHKLIFLDIENDIIKLDIEKNTIYCLVNLRIRNCILFSKDLEVEKIRDNIIKNLEKHKLNSIYY